MQNNFLVIYLDVYKCSVVITWETDLPTIEKWIKKNCKKEVVISDEWHEDMKKEMATKISGLTIPIIDDGDPDNLIWLKKLPTKASEFGTLYHELYHATDFILTSKSMRNERESGAYIFQRLVDQANQFFWDPKLIKKSKR